MTFRLPQFHENEQLLTWAQTDLGRLAIWVGAMALLLWHDSSASMLAAFSAVLLFPARRRLLLSIAAVGAAAERFGDARDFPLAVSPQWPLVAAMVVAGLYLAFLLAQRARYWPAIVRRHPVATLHLGIWFALSLSVLPWLGALRALPLFAWRLSYLAVSGSRGAVATTRFRDHLFYLVPVFGGSFTPIGKGLDFLSRHEAGDSGAVARSQLAGINLLLLALVWTVALAILDVVVHGETSEGLAAWLFDGLSGWSLNLPQLDHLLQAGTQPLWYSGWIAIYLNLIQETLRLAIFGHVIVGCLRLLGFNVFRNTYKPLLAESIVEFWNRYYYYFKEVMVDFFFYPTYLRMQRLGPATRMFAAVFAAAFFGNMYFHVLYDSPEQVVQLDAVALWALWGPRLVYCFLLAFGIWISMLRQPKLRTSAGKPGLGLKVRRIAGVWTFYSIIQIWNVQLDGVGIGDCTALFLSLFGIY